MQLRCSILGAAVHGVQTAGSWLSILALSGSLTFVINQTLVRGVSEPLIDQELRVVSAAEPRSSGALAALTEPSMQWVILSSSSREGVGRSLVCLTNADRFAADTIELDPVDMDRLAADLHCQA